MLVRLTTNLGYPVDLYSLFTNVTGYNFQLIGLQGCFVFLVIDVSCHDLLLIGPPG